MMADDWACVELGNWGNLADSDDLDVSGCFIGSCRGPFKGQRRHYRDNTRIVLRVRGLLAEARI